LVFFADKTEKKEYDGGRLLNEELLSEESRNKKAAVVFRFALWLE